MNEAWKSSEGPETNNEYAFFFAHSDLQFNYNHPFLTY